MSDEVKKNIYLYTQSDLWTKATQWTDRNMAFIDEDRQKDGLYRQVVFLSKTLCLIIEKSSRYMSWFTGWQFRLITFSSIFKVCLLDQTNPWIESIHFTLFLFFVQNNPCRILCNNCLNFFPFRKKPVYDGRLYWSNAITIIYSRQPLYELKPNISKWAKEPIRSQILVNRYEAVTLVIDYQCIRKEKQT